MPYFGKVLKILMNGSLRHVKLPCCFFQVLILLVKSLLTKLLQLTALQTVVTCQAGVRTFPKPSLHATSKG